MAHFIIQLSRPDTVGGLQNVTVLIYSSHVERLPNTSRALPRCWHHNIYMVSHPDDVPTDTLAADGDAIPGSYIDQLGEHRQVR